jgi:hypothetical protein
MLRLSAPPDYEYQTVGPWWVTDVHPDGTVGKPRTYPVFESAVLAFWNHDSPSFHRSLLDARGATILGISIVTGGSEMVGTRQTMDETLKIVEANAPEEEVVEVLAMVEKVREMKGYGVER